MQFKQNYLYTFRGNKSIRGSGDQINPIRIFNLSPYPNLSDIYPTTHNWASFNFVFGNLAPKTKLALLFGFCNYWILPKLY